MRLNLPRLLATAAALGAVAAAPSAAAASKTDHVVVSKADGTEIAISVHKPDSASPENPVPVILHSHGWGGSRNSSDGAFSTELGRGYGVVSIDQRGHGASGGQANVEDPDFEGLDMISVIDFVASLDWVAKDAGTTDDPVLFAMGGSYGGGYQFVAAFTEMMKTGETRLNAIAPEITWFNLSESLAPSGVVRTAWVTLLYAAGASMVPDYIHQAFAYGAATGQWPDGTVPGIPDMEEEFFNHGPSGHVAKAGRLNIPVLFGQGLTDNLFNLNQAWKNMEQALTPGARSQSLFVGYNDGHALPNVLPLGTGATSDPCSGAGGYGGLRLRFFDAIVAGEDPSALLPAKYNMATTAGDCIRTATLDDTTAFKTGVDATVTSGTATTTGVGAPQHHEIAKGPRTISGIPTVDATVTSVGADQRVFFAISVGTSPADAQVVQNNTMPLRELLPVVRQKRTIELPGIAVKVPAGQSAFLTVSPVSDMYFGHGSIRTPGVVGLEDITVNLPLVDDGSAAAKRKKAKSKRAKSKRSKRVTRKRRR